MKTELEKKASEERIFFRIRRRIRDPSHGGQVDILPAKG